LASSPHRLFWLFFIGLFLYRLLVIIYGDVPVDVEEAYYLSWTANLDWGYYSKPPLLPFVLAWATIVFGYNAAVIKIISLLLFSFSTVGVFFVSRAIYGEKVAYWAATAFLSLPAVGLLSVFISTDSLLLLAWSFALFSFVQAEKTNDKVWWVALGVFGGLGMLSKYSFALLPIGIFLYLLASESRRRLLLSSGLWFALLIACLIWAPNVFWLIEHDWITLIHTRDISGVDASRWSFKLLIEFLASQVAVIGPIFSIGFLILIFKKSSSRDAVFLFTSLPLFLAISLQSAQSEANANWAMPAYVGLMPFLTSKLMNLNVRVLVAAVILNLLFSAGIYHYHFLARSFDIEMKKGNDPFHRQMGWDSLVEKINQRIYPYPYANLLSPDRKILAYMNFYSPSKSRVLYGWSPSGNISSQYALVNRLNNVRTGAWIFISASEIKPEISKFERVKFIGMVDQYVYSNKSLTYYLYLVENFKGY